ncbi:MAG: response regulator [Zoogloeaceae bacterium]|jgi:serine/threonine-protein kinase|nr:response regulator [Zoogloeaceae bacterium]
MNNKHEQGHGGEQNKATLLFVDDEELIVKLLSMLFRNGYNVLTATSGKEALKLLAGNQVDVLVSDQRMPGMAGIDLLREARRVSPGTTPILLTGYSDLMAIVGSINEGEVFRFLSKPWNDTEIRQTIADAVTAARATQSANNKAKTAPPATVAADEAPTVLLIDDHPGNLQAMVGVLAGKHRIRTANSIPAALGALERDEDIGVIITEIRVGNADMMEFLRLLKQHYPVITTIMLTEASDANQMIELINQAQIFRFATKPMRRSLFQDAVDSAIEKYQTLKNNPALAAARYSVKGGRDNEDASPLAKDIKRSLRSRLKAFFGVR